MVGIFNILEIVTRLCEEFENEGRKVKILVLGNKI
jgi:hypothetical protein